MAGRELAHEVSTPRKFLPRRSSETLKMIALLSATLVALFEVLAQAIEILRGML